MHLIEAPTKFSSSPIFLFHSGDEPVVYVVRVLVRSISSTRVLLGRLELLAVLSSCSMVTSSLPLQCIRAAKTPHEHDLAWGRPTYVMIQRQSSAALRYNCVDREEHDLALARPTYATVSKEESVASLVPGFAGREEHDLPAGLRHAMVMKGKIWQEN